jgi:hypothetical protein
MLFDRLLRAQLQRVLISASVLSMGCIGDGDPDPDAMCNEVTAKSSVAGELSREPGFLKLPVGESCPTEPDLSTLQAADCCPVLEPKASCGLVDERVGTEQPYYGGYDTAPPEEATICEYDAVFLAGAACCGRPLYVSGSALLAPVTPVQSDWSETPSPIAASPQAHSVAVAYWREVARMEHASVASFGRVALELMRHGAPADLIRRAHEAALDEIHHAQFAFGIVESLTGEANSPGPLPLGSSVAIAERLADVAEAVVREGCIGETLAAMDAAARLPGAKGVIADALATIVDDESRHAGLAWATLKWLLAVGGEPVRARVDGLFAEMDPMQTALPELPEGGTALGLIDDATRSRALRDAWFLVIQPAWAAIRQPPATIERPATR